MLLKGTIFAVCGTFFGIIVSILFKKIMSVLIFDIILETGDSNITVSFLKSVLMLGKFFLN
jgi:hypothetical protein